MIRIITKRNEADLPIEMEGPYESREVGEVPGTLALRFDAELAALKLAGMDLCGVKRWTAAVFRVRRFSARARDMVVQVTSPGWLLTHIEAEQADWGREHEHLPEDQRRAAFEEWANERREEAIEEWVATQPDYLLAQIVGYWAAINLGGGHRTLLDVLQIPDRDIEELTDVPEWPQEDDAEGKA